MSIVQEYWFKDDTGTYTSSVAIIKINGRWVAAYEDFPNIISMSRWRHMIDFQIPNMLKRLYAEEDGVFIHNVWLKSSRCISK